MRFLPGTEVKVVFSISYSLNSSLLKIQTWQSNFMCKETAGNRINAGEIQKENLFLISYLWKTKIENRLKIPVTGAEGKTGSGANQSKTALVWGPCGFRPFDFYSKLKIENQKFTIVCFNVWLLKNWKSQIYNLNCQFLFLRNIKLKNNFQCFKKSKIDNWKWPVGGFYFLFLKKRKTKR